MKKLKYALVIGCLPLFMSCSSEEALLQLSPENRFELGLQKFQDEDYTEAEKDFRIVTLQFQGTAYADDAQFYIGECQYMREQYIMAAYEYEVLIRTMPTSELLPRARYRRAMCYYNLSPDSYRDQDYTRKAIDEFQAFVEYFPTDTLAGGAAEKIRELIEKLAKKEYDNGILYMRMESYKAATYCFDVVLEKYHDTPYAEKALLKKTEALYFRKRYSEAKTTIDRYLEKYPDGESREEAEKLRNDIVTKLAGGEDNAAKDRQTSPNPIKQY